MSSVRPNPSSGEVWFAWQLMFGDDRTAIKADPCTHKWGTATVPVVEHPALLLTRGDERALGYLVCFFSTKGQHFDNVHLGPVLNDRDSYLINTAPVYCHRKLLCDPMHDATGETITADPVLTGAIVQHMTLATHTHDGACSGNAIVELVSRWFHGLRAGISTDSPDSDVDTVLDVAVDPPGVRSPA